MTKFLIFRFLVVGFTVLKFVKAFLMKTLYLHFDLLYNSKNEL